MQGSMNVKNINICVGLKPWKRIVLHNFFLVLPFWSSREASSAMWCSLISWNTDTTNDNKSEWWLSIRNCVPKAEIHPLFQSPLGLYATPWLPITTSRWRLHFSRPSSQCCVYRMSMVTTFGNPTVPHNMIRDTWPAISIMSRFVIFRSNFLHSCVQRHLKERGNLFRVLYLK